MKTTNKIIKTKLRRSSSYIYSTICGTEFIASFLSLFFHFLFISPCAYYFFLFIILFSGLVLPTVSASLLQPFVFGILYHPSCPSSVVLLGCKLFVHSLAAFSQHWPRPLPPFLSHLPFKQSSKIIKEDKVKLSPRATKAYRRLDVKLHSFLTSALDEGVSFTLRPLYPLQEPQQEARWNPQPV